MRINSLLRLHSVPRPIWWATLVFKKIRITARKGKEGSNIARVIRDILKSNKVLCDVLHFKGNRRFGMSDDRGDHHH